jgi:hypothetical protein
MEISFPDHLKNAPRWRRDIYELQVVISGAWDEGGTGGVLLVLGFLLLSVTIFPPMAAYSQWRFRRGTHPSQVRHKAYVAEKLADGAVAPIRESSQYAEGNRVKVTGSDSDDRGQTGTVCRVEPEQRWCWDDSCGCHSLERVYVRLGTEPDNWDVFSPTELERVV